MPSSTDERLPTSIALALGVADAAAVGVAAYIVFAYAPLAVVLGSLSGAGGYLLLMGLVGADATDDAAADDRGVAGTGLAPTALGVALSNAAVGGFAAAFVVGVDPLVAAGVLGAGLPGYVVGTLLAGEFDADAATAGGD
jgi:hypothetical protein